jgi:hypothetical protein
MGRPRNPNTPVCVHCRLRGGDGGRGLCRNCHRRPEICNLYRPGRNGRPPVKPVSQFCRHCQIQAARAARGLCHRCWRIVEIRSLYSTEVDGKVEAG